MNIVWIIAGSDPSGAAGCQRDLLTVAEHGVHACTVITAATAQNFSEWSSANVLDHNVVAAQLHALTSPAMPKPKAVKIGMLGSAAIVSMVAEQISRQSSFVILDPLIKASSGGRLGSEEVLGAIKNILLPHVDLLTPNIDEASILTSSGISDPTDVPSVANKLLSLGVRRVLIKGGHLTSNRCHDYYADNSSSYWLTTDRLPISARGTGCALASAVAANIAKAHNLHDSLIAARIYVTNQIRSALDTNTGTSLLGWGQRQIESSDLPSRTNDLLLDSDLLNFPSCGPEPLGFYPIVDSFAWVKRLVDVGAKTIQLRIKDQEGLSLINEIKQTISYCRACDVRLFINDHWRLALELQAYGVHLGQEDLLTADLAAIAKAGLRLGVSTHCLSEAAVAKSINPSYVALGPIFPTTCKSLRFGPHGLDQITTWRQMFSQPVVAIGGLKAEHAPDAINRGASGVAVISDVVNAKSPETRAQQWLRACSQNNSITANKDLTFS